MLPLLAPGLVWLVCGFTTVCGSTLDAASQDDCYRKTCMDREYDIREAVCRENRLHLGAALSCCGDQAFNPAAATCCKVGDEYTLTEGLSEKVSACCGVKAYNSLNEICCESTVITKPVPKAHCCGKEAFDEDSQLCCGPSNNKMILARSSSHHQCCGHDQYNTETQCCHWINNTPVIHGINSTRCAESAVCGKNNYNANKELCCQSTVVAKPAQNAKCCGELAIDADSHLCCGPSNNKTILARNSNHHQCCGHDQYNTETQCCCWMNDTPVIHGINSPCCAKSAVCGTNNYNVDKELCCQSTVVAKPAQNAKCCGEQAIDADSQLCCGPSNNKMILARNSNHHQCCGHDQYNTETQCCHWMNDTPVIHGINSPCCAESGVQPQNHGPQPICSKPRTSLCGSSCYNPHEFRCCERNQARRSTGQCDAAPTVYNPRTHICCGGRVSVRKPLQDQCHGSPGQHCCGTEVYWPHTQLCCAGRRHFKAENMQCCGVQAYNIKNQDMKCCAGTLHNVTHVSGKLDHEMQCCGSILQRPEDVCCMSEDKELLYSAKTGFRCCGHLYYNTSLWSCCAGQLNPVHQPGHRQNNNTITESRLHSLKNLKETDLCGDMLIGTVDRVSPHSIVFSTVLKINGTTATVRALPSPYILQIHDHCNSPKLIPGKIYFFREVNFFAYFNHGSTLQSLHFIISKCHRR